MKSDTFSDMFKIANESNQESGEGSSTENPIVMSGVTASDFEALLTVLYATYATIFPLLEYLELEAITYLRLCVVASRRTNLTPRHLSSSQPFA